MAQSEQSWSTLNYAPCALHLQGDCNLALRRDRDRFRDRDRKSEKIDHENDHEIRSRQS